MPMVNLKIPVSLPEETRRSLLSSVSKIIAIGIGKPEKYVMVTIEEDSIMMSGKEGSAAFIDLRSIGGLNKGVNRELSRKLCDLLEEKLQVPPDRVYINFSDITAQNWGWDGSTFG